MSNYINFFPGDTREEREISINDNAAYGMGDIIELVDSIIVGCTGSADVAGAKEALEDGSIWGDLCAKHGDDAVQDALEELHALLDDRNEA